MDTLSSEHKQVIKNMINENMDEQKKMRILNGF